MSENTENVISVNPVDEKKKQQTKIKTSAPVAHSMSGRKTAEKNSNSLSVKQKPIKERLNKEKQQDKKQEGKSENGKIALILVRGFIGMKKDIAATLYSLRLRKKHSCVVLIDNLQNRACALKCKDYIAYGEIDGITEKMLVEKRGMKDSDGKLKKYFLLHPPRGGFERKGIKKSFVNGGALGYRKEKINDLIKRML